MLCGTLLVASSRRVAVTTISCSKPPPAADELLLTAPFGGSFAVCASAGVARTTDIAEARRAAAINRNRASIIPYPLNEPLPQEAGLDPSMTDKRPVFQAGDE